METDNLQTIQFKLHILRLIAVVALTLLLSTLLTPFVVTALQLTLENFSYPFSRVFDRVALSAVVLSIWLIFFKSAPKKRFSDQALFADESNRHHHNILNKSLALIILSQARNLSHTFENHKIEKSPHLIINTICQADSSNNPSFPSIKDTVISYSIILLLGIVSSLFIALPSIQQGELYLRGVTLAYSFKKLALIVPGALITALIEEMIFRRFLLGNFLAMGIRSVFSIGIVSVIFSFVHFIVPIKGFEYREFNPWAGFEYMGLVLGRFAHPELYLGILGMFLIGCCLGALFTIKRSVVPAILLHAGFIIGLKTTFFSTRMIPSLEFDQVITRRYILLSNPTSWAVIFGVGLLSILAYKMHVKRSEIWNRGETVSTLAKTECSATT